MTRKRYFLIGCMLLIPISMALAQSPFYNAREMGMAGAYGAVAHGADAVNWNPANLGLVLTSGFTLQMPGMGMRVLNTSFGLADYNRYNGAVLAQEEKAEILSKIPDDGLKLVGNGGGMLLGVSISRLALALRLRGLSDMVISRDFFELILNGNELGREYDFSQTAGSGWAMADVSISYGQAFYVPYLNDFAVGVSLHWLKGLGMAEIVESRGRVLSDFEGLSGDGFAKLRTASGGNGFSIDIGLAGITKNNVIISLAVHNLASHIRWDQEVQIYEYGIRTDSLTVEALVNEDSDSLITDLQEDYPGEAFSAYLPLELKFGAAYAFSDWLLSGQLIQALQKAPGINRVPYVALGAEWRRLSFLPLRFGLAFGGTHRFSTSLGFSLKIGPFCSNFAFQTINQLLPSRGTGYGLAMDISLGL
ncbi:MAG: DUF5723 family protein [candidate division KSB1 bacterium]|nr:DUF5723 family protein [candidate division KSB1 bacterium]